MKAKTYYEATARLEKLQKLLTQVSKNSNDRRYPAGEPGGKGGQYAPRGAGVSGGAHIKISKDDAAPGVTRYRFTKGKKGKDIARPELPETPAEKAIRQSSGYIDLTGGHKSNYSPESISEGQYKFVKGKDGEWHLKRKKDKK